MLVMEPWRHAVRGMTAALGAVTVASNVMGNRSALLSLSPTLEIRPPTRNAAAIALFVGVFRFVERLQSLRRLDHHSAVEHATLLASIAAVLCMDPQSRTPIVALLSTNAASLWFQEFVARHPEIGALKAADLVAFLSASGWIMYSALMAPESYVPSHLKLITKYALCPRQAATIMQDGYRRGINVNPCEARHPGRNCTDFTLRTMLWKGIAMGLRIYAPVHLTTWLFSLRRGSVRSKPMVELLRKLVDKMVRSMLYYLGFVVVGWHLSCVSQNVGARSLTWRKAQYLLCGSLPSLSILFETPSRRRPIGVILSSYSFVSMGTVLSRQRGFGWLRQGSGPLRTLLDVLAFSVAVAYTFESVVDTNAFLRRGLLGKDALKKMGKARPFASKRSSSIEAQDIGREAKQ
ncbi:hypothetical protein ATCC90586_003452 [Pythium insidiosum]|nr:hypothetical protein ATCC90586_003452 [Pythium insidiosum]